MSETPLKVWHEHEGKLLRLRLARPKANLIDAAMIAALQQALDQHLGEPRLCSVLLDHEGPHFSFGASVAEHLPDQCAAMLASLHRLIRTVLGAPVPVLVAIRGQCLGGGLELAAAGHILFAAPEARLGQPEIQLGVFPPAATALLPERMARGAAESLLYGGQSISGVEAQQAGLVTVVAEDPEAAALDWFAQGPARHSPSSLRLGVRAARAELVARVLPRLDQLEQLYLRELMSTHDAHEGLNAFLAKRPPVWEGR